MKQDNILPLMLILLFMIPCSILLLIGWLQIPISADSAIPSLTITATPVETNGTNGTIGATETPNPLSTATTAPISEAATPIGDAPATLIIPIATNQPTATNEPIATSEPIASSEPTSEPTATSIPTSTALPPEPVAPIPPVVGGAAPQVEEEGFVISVVADSAVNPFPRPTSLTWDAAGVMYLSSMDGHIIRVSADGTRSTFAEGFDVPLGMDFRPNTNELYVSHRGGISKVEDNNQDGVADTQEPLVTGMHCCYAELHQTNGLQFGADGWLYFSQGSSSDHGDFPIEEWEAGILRVNPDEGQDSLEYVAKGVRNGYDLVVRTDGEIFAGDNGADSGPPEELNHIIPGEHYGWPHCFTEQTGQVAPDPSWNDPTLCENSQPAIATFDAHFTPTGITAYEGQQYPPEYQNNLFLAFWNRHDEAHRVVRVQLTPNGDTYTTQVTPFVTDLHLPTDVTIGPDGALYIVDWEPGRVYKVEYRGQS